jgi:hypothetical protein
MCSTAVAASIARRSRARQNQQAALRCLM